MRKAGVILPIFSLPNKYGIGTLGKEAYDFIDFLELANQTYWQVLPIGPTSYGDSPYQSFSCFAGNPYFIDFDLLREDGLLELNDYSYLERPIDKINYEELYNTRFTVLKKAFLKFDISLLEPFNNENSYWLEDYAMFMTLKYLNNGKEFTLWEDSYKYRDEKTIKKFKEEYSEDISFWKFLQYEFFKQYRNLKEYASIHKVKIIGDMPIYTAMDSSDVWAHKEEFLLNDNFIPSFVAGVPGDDFTPLGQLWGNPLYDYKYMKNNHYEFFKQRFKIASSLYDIIRIDHFRGFEAFFAVPYGDTNALNGKWMKGPNHYLFDEINKEFGNLEIIAENLGFLTKEVDIMLKKLNYPGMKVLEFGFNSKGESDAIPHNLEYNMAVYPGTHDNDTLRGWFDSLDSDDKKYVKNYLFFDSDYESNNAIIRCALASPCKYAIISFIDYLQLPSEYRINTPSTLGGNWVTRISEKDMNKDLAIYISNLTHVYRRDK